jgi:hypothetical protein
LAVASSGLRARRDDAAGVEPAIRAQNPQAGSEPLLGMLSAGEHGADQAFGVGPDFAGPAAEAVRRPFGVKPVGTGHVIRVRAVLATHVAALMDRDALAAMEHLDDALGDADLDFGANEGVRNRVGSHGPRCDSRATSKPSRWVDPCASPFCELPILGRQAVEVGAFYLLEQLAPAKPEMAHGALVHALHDEFDGLVAFGEREVGLRAQSPENVCLSESDAGLDLRLVSWFVRPRRKDSHGIMRRHRAIGSVDLGVVERSFVDAALQIVRDQQFRHAAKETKHANMSAGPIRQLLRPGGLGVSEI